MNTVGGDNPFARFTVDPHRRRRTLKWQAYPPDVLPLWVAEMDTLLPEAVADAVTDAVTRGEVGYPWGHTYPEALAAFAAREWGWAPDPATMRHSADVMSGLANLIRVTTGGDGVLVITPPVYPPFLELPAVTGLPVRYAPLTATGRLDLPTVAAVLVAARRDRQAPTVLLCNPHNPTGVAHSRAELEQLARLAAEHGARVLVDEIHAPLVHPGATFTPYLSVPGAERSYAVHSASKAFNLAGLKAAMIVPGEGAVDELTRRLPLTVDHSASSIGVLAHSVALTEAGVWLAAHRAGLAANRALLGELLAHDLPGVRWQLPEATYLAWLDCSGLGLSGGPAEEILARARVALSSGETFGPGGADHVRLNFATAPQVLTEAVQRIRTALGE